MSDKELIDKIKLSSLYGSFANKYDFHTLVKMKFGSHLYGTNTPDSDTDFKGVFMPSRDQACQGEIPRSVNINTKVDGNQKNTSDDVDIEMFSLPRFIELACEGDTAALDMLHAPDDMLIVCTPLWKDIVSRRHRFYTKNLKTSFTGYAKKQAGKYAIKGSRLNAVKEILSFLRAQDPRTRMRDIWDQLPINEYAFIIKNEVNGKEEYEVCEKRAQPAVKVMYVIQMLEAHWKKYGYRAEQAAENKGIDWKAVSHAIRAAIQVKQILSEGTIIFPLVDAPFLRDVKLGKLDYTSVVAPRLEDLMVEVQELVANSDLPETPDIAYWRSYVHSMVLDHISL